MTNQNLQTLLLTLLRLFIGAIFDTALFVFRGVDVLTKEIPSVSESESCSFGWTGCFLFKGAMSFNISF